MSLILVANPGSASRKYALFDGANQRIASLHFEIVEQEIRCTLTDRDGTSQVLAMDFHEIGESASHVQEILRMYRLIEDHEIIEAIGIRIVAPSKYFLQHRIVTDETINKLKELSQITPLHIAAALYELEFLKKHFPSATIAAVSDSAFHITKPSYAWNYGIDIHDADTYDIKRFGFHGLSVEGSLDALRNAQKMTPKIIVCHLGSGSSVTAVFNGKSIDTTMGFTPLEGIIMATRSGTIDASAVHVLQARTGMDDAAVEKYLYTKGGLLGLGGSNDIRELIERENRGDHLAHLALSTLVHSIHKAIGQMLVTLDGADMLVFTGTVGERSAILRKRIVSHLQFTDFILDGSANENCLNPTELTIVSQKAKSKPIIVIPANEGLQIAKAVRTLVDK